MWRFCLFYKDFLELVLELILCIFCYFLCEVEWNGGGRGDFKFWTWGVSWTPKAFTGIDSMSKNVNIAPLPDYCNIVFNTILCGFYYKNKEFCQKVRVFADAVILNTICKWFTNMNIIDKTALIKGYKIVMIWQDIKIYMMWLKNGSR